MAFIFSLRGSACLQCKHTEKPWCCSSQVHAFQSMFLCGAKLCRFAAALENNCRIFSITHTFSETVSWHPKHMISLQWWSHDHDKVYWYKSKRHIASKDVLLNKIASRGVAIPLLSNNYSQLMGWYGQQKSAVYPGYWITSAGSKSFSFGQHHHSTLCLDVNLSNPWPDMSV